MTQFGQIVSTSADRLILNQNKTLLWIAAKNKVLTADKIATAEDGLGKVFCNPVNCGRIAESTYSNVGLGSSLRGEPGLTTFRSQGCP